MGPDKLVPPMHVLPPSEETLTLREVTDPPSPAEQVPEEE